MRFVKDRLWAIFFFVVFLSLLFLTSASYYIWTSDNKTISGKHTHLINILSNAFNSHLISKETILNILSDEIVKKSLQSDQFIKPKLFDELLLRDPSMIGLAVIDPDGNFLYISNSTDLSRLPNLTELEFSRDSFLRTFDCTDRLVLGRTYFFKPLNSWVIPIRKAIVGVSGEPLAVISSAVNFSNASDILTGNLHLGKHSKFMLLRDFDGYFQFVSSENNSRRDWYKTSIPKEFYVSLESALKDKYDISLHDAKETGELYNVVGRFIDDQAVSFFIKYNKRYELWFISQQDFSSITNKYIKKIFILGAIFAVILCVFYTLFKYIADAERRKKESLRYQAGHDDLTSLPNRNSMIATINSLISDNNKAFAIYVIDMDNFKNINDSYGHILGDQVIRLVALRLKTFAKDDLFVCRHGGDEFAIFTEYSDDDVLALNAKKLIEHISKPYIIDTVNLTLSASIGIAKFPEHGNSMEKMLKAADIALFEAKKEKNNAVVFANSMEEDYTYKIQIEQELRKAKDNNELHMVYQPQIDPNGNMYGVEALIRWQNERLGFVRPDKFISVAETTGLMPSVGSFVINQSLQEIKDVYNMTNTNFVLSINISLKQFIQKDFMETLINSIHKVKFLNTNIKLEITEGLFIEDVNTILPLLNQIRSHGIKISLDDFGTGYSSLNVLRLLPIDELKIDKSFIDDILTDISSQKMIQNIIDISSNLGLNVIAEGVETIEQIELLKELGCLKYQGYYYSKPLKKDALVEYIKSKN
jgi:diguanylate cyclase (GGDEF)-like protein